MTLSLRLRLTLWYSCLVLVALGVFVTIVLWLQWTMLVRQVDENLEAIAAMSISVTADELSEHADLPAAADVTREVLKSSDDLVTVLDAHGRAVGRDAGLNLRPEDAALLGVPGRHTVTDTAGRQWRTRVRAASGAGVQWLAVAAEPIGDLQAQWRTLLRATAVGLPLALAIAAAGGLWLGRRGLAPLTTIAAEAREITASTPDARLTVPPRRDELAEVAQAFNHTLGRLGSALEEQRRFMADASHELRTPLSIMRTAADVTLSRTDRTSQEYREALDTIAQQSARLARLVDDMFVLARADAGGYRRVSAPVDLGAVVRECAMDLCGEAERRGLRTRIDVPPASFVAGDEMLLRRLVLNLMLNAIAYNREGGMLDLSVRAVDGRQEVRVADSGPGIPPDAHERIFERFVRLDPARAAGGAGLGLAIARWIAQVHGGTLVLAESGPRGSVFLLRLPAISVTAGTALTV